LSNATLLDMPIAAQRFVDDPDRVRSALSPSRRGLLRRLATPASATELASAMDLPRQKVNYHLRQLEAAGLVELVEERRRRGCVERVMRASADAFVVDPTVLSVGSTVVSRDQFAAEHLVGAAATTVRDVSRMRAAAAERGQHLLTFTIEADVAFAEPADVHRFTDALAEAVARTAEEFGTDGGGRRYRIVVSGHPTPAPEKAHHD
jgi:DNA-binding transcriptional ArsR family regulator